MLGLLASVCVSAQSTQWNSEYTSSKGILLPPLPGKTGPVKVLIYVHGALINEKNYVTLSKSIQEATNLTLWLGLPSFVLDTPNPATITAAVTGMVKSIGEAGNFTVAKENVFVAAHSLGGVFAPAVVAKEGYAGMLEFGAYVTGSGLDIKTTSFPVLTLGGELDGLTRVSRLALEYEKMASLPAVEHTNKPVAILPGVCHSQFCEGVNVTSFGVHDLVPEVTWSEAHASISLAAADFLHIQCNTSAVDVAAAKARFEARFKYTEALVGGFLAARHAEAVAGPSSGGDWCARVQSTVVAVAPAATGGPYSIDVTVPSNLVVLAGSHPGVSEDGSKVAAVAYAAYSLNPIDVSTVPVAAKSLTCEMITADQIAVRHLKPGSGGVEPPKDLCKAANEAAILWAEHLLSSATVQRFKAKGQQIVTVSDEIVSTGPGFLSSSLTFSAPAEFTKPVAVRGVGLATATNAKTFPGVYQCIVLSPAKAAEWMMVDGLPKLP